MASKVTTLQTAEQHWLWKELKHVWTMRTGDVKFDLAAFLNFVQDSARVSDIANNE
jgi:hypothetical protein